MGGGKEMLVMGNLSLGSDDNNVMVMMMWLGEGKYAFGGYRAFSFALSFSRRMNFVLKGLLRNVEKVWMLFSCCIGKDFV